jgi:hypothetical protein
MKSVGKTHAVYPIVSEPPSSVLPSTLQRLTVPTTQQGGGSRFFHGGTGAGLRKRADIAQFQTKKPQFVFAMHPPMNQNTTTNRTSITRAAATLRCDRQTLRHALDHAKIEPDSSGRFCSDCCRLALSLWRFRDDTAESVVIARWLARELGPL